MNGLDRWEAALELLAFALVAAGWIIGGFPDPNGTGALLFAAGVILAGVPAVRRLVAAATGGDPYRRQ